MRSRRLLFPALMLVSAGTVVCAQSAPHRFQAQPVARNLETPWSLAFAPDGRLFVAERPGRIRVITRDSLDPVPWATIPVHESVPGGMESGLMGLAIDPAFARSPRVYICYTHAEAGRPHSNRIAVLTEEKGRGVRLAVLLGGIPANSYHNGCRLKFGPDGKLYATTGDAGSNRAQGDSAQSRTSLAGKVLRLNADGTIPSDNPSPDSYIWSLGHRNAQGLAFEPGNGRLWATEHGTGAGGNNELNLIERGRNYGWPIAIGTERDNRFTDPVAVWPDAPAGATFVNGDKYPDLRGALVVATLSSKRLLLVRLPSSAAAPSREVLIDGEFGRLRDVVQGPDGFLYLATSNRDGRGTPEAGADQVLRLLPRP
jgi:glucose/arabinose dehydrogenase